MPAANSTPISRTAALSPATALSRSTSPDGSLAPDSRTTRSSVRMLVIGMIPAMIGTSQPAAATLSRSRR